MRHRWVSLSSRRSRFALSWSTRNFVRRTTEKQPHQLSFHLPVRINSLVAFRTKEEWPPPRPNSRYLGDPLVGRPRQSRCNCSTTAWYWRVLFIDLVYCISSGWAERVFAHHSTYSSVASGRLPYLINGLDFSVGAHPCYRDTTARIRSFQGMRTDSHELKVAGVSTDPFMEISCKLQVYRLSPFETICR